MFEAAPQRATPAQSADPVIRAELYRSPEVTLTYRREGAAHYI